MLNSHPQTNGTSSDALAVPAQKMVKGKSKALEDIYQKKTQLEHILLRPDTYIGSVEKNTETTWVYDSDKEAILQKEVTYVPGLYKIFDEILVNAADHKQRDDKMDTIKIDINQEDNIISIWNNGKGIPVAMHKNEKMFVPTMIFGHLLTSSNYDDEEQKVTGGRNGYGAKLCNIFSTKFCVETGCKDYKKSFKQAWANNMSKASEPKIKEFSGSEYTKITFSPDLAKFKMDSLDDDIVSIMSRRAFDVAASSRGVKVFLNGKKVPIKNFKEYVDLFLKEKQDDDGNQLKCIYELANPRWEVAVALSDKGFQQMSFVNSIATTKGGRHVDYVTDMIVKNLVDALKKKNKSGVNIKPFQIKNHMWVFVNCLIVNPTFDSQTKENMTLQAKSFGSKCSFTDKFISGVSKSGIIEAIMMWAKFKQQAQLQSKCAGKKQNKIKGLPKLEDANDAGTRFSSDCTLILTEGDSAKTLAVAGLSVVGRDRYGVFPLKGKLLNVREASHKQILENAEINNVIKILGLQYKKKYDSVDDVKTLRYGKLMIMTDQDQDGSHIKGLLINFIHHNWPTLLRQSFLEEFITPIVKATKGKEEIPFYSLPEFEEWKKSKDNWQTYHIKYYKGLGTSTSKEAKEYFQDMIRHRIKFKHDGAQDDHSINMAFSKKAVDQRKEWLTAWMLECKRRKELGLSDIYLYEKNTRSINYSDFVNKELVLFSNLDNERSIPSLVDGLKPGQRKVLFTCLKRKDKKEIKVAQLAGSVAEHSAYHHGEASLMATIIGLAQNYVGSNNINLLKPIGQFGTRLQGGKDAASPRYIFTQLSSLTKFIFHPDDENIITHLKDDNQVIEPEWYIPIIPMVLVNGAEGIGTGWSTKIPNYNPRELVENIRRMMRGEEMLPMKPWFKNFRGTVDELDFQKYVISGEAGRLSHDKYEITELPIRTWTQHYKETVMEVLLQGTEKNPALISDYREYHTDVTVRFVVTVPESKVAKMDEEGPHKVFKLQTTMSLSSMVLFDHNGCLKKYETVADMLQEFYDLRLKYYGKRKAYLVGKLEADANLLSNKARFILEKCDGRLTIENKKKKDMIAELQRKGYDSDPVKLWKRAYDKDSALEEEDTDNLENEDRDFDSKLDFDYLLGMAMWFLTKEKKDKLLQEKEETLYQLNTLKKKSPSDLWEEDLSAFIKELDKVEEQEREDEAGTRKKKSGIQLGGKQRKKAVAEEVLPSPCAERIAPRIDPELRKKVEKAAQAKEKGKRVKKEVLENDEYDDIVNTSTGKSLAERIGGSPDQIEKNVKKEKKEKKLKQTKLNFSPKKITVDTSDEELENSDAEDFASSPPVQIEPRERAGGRRAAAAKVKYQFSDEEESEKSDSDLSFHSNDGVEEPEMIAQQMSFNDSILNDVVSNEAKKSSPPGNTKSSNVEKKNKTKPKANGKNFKNDDKKLKSDEIEISDTDSEFGERVKPTKPKLASKKTVTKPTASDMFDSLISTNSPTKSNETTPEKIEPSRKRAISSSDSDGGDNGPTFASRVMANMKKKETKKVTKVTKKSEIQTKAPAKRGPKKTAAAKRKANSDSESDDGIFEVDAKKSTKSKKEMNEDEAEVARRAASGRSKKSVKYTFGESESDEDF